MKTSAFRAAATLYFASVFCSQATAASGPDPLFDDDDILTTRLVAPFGQIMTERPDSKKNEVSGTFSFVGADGAELEFSVKLLTRGNNRRKPEVCTFAPLQLNFKKSDVKNTLFHKQDKLKLVTHCINKREFYRQAVIREYLAYRILNAVTDYSFRVRLLRMSYIFSDDKNEEELTYAFLIESKERLAKRLDMEKQAQNSVHLEQLDREHTNLVSVFQYFIGNVDFSPVKGQSGKPCCHNYALFSPDGEKFWSIPYDFDLTGLVEPPHVILNPKFRQNSIRQRIYRGRCYNNEYIPASLRKFRDSRTEIESIIAGETELSDRHRKRVDSYVESFYKLLDNEAKLIKKFENACIG
jgi:hypothetical protein